MSTYSELHRRIAVLDREVDKRQKHGSNPFDLGQAPDKPRFYQEFLATRSVYRVYPTRHVHVRETDTYCAAIKKLLYLDDRRQIWSRDIRKLPVEILSTIFTFAADSPDSNAPDTLPLVCSWWKKVAEQTFSLYKWCIWDELTSMGSLLARMERSQGHPIHIVLKLPFEGTPSESFEIKRCLTYTAAHLSHCKSLEVHSQCERQTLQVIGDLRQRDLRQLTEFRLYASSGQQWLFDLSDDVKDVLQGTSSNFKVLSLDRVHVIRRMWSPNALACLTTLHISVCHSEGIIGTLRMCRNLESLELSDADLLDGGPWDDKSKLLLPKLKRLVLRQISRRDMEGFLRRLATPALQHLGFDLMDQDPLGIVMQIGKTPCLLPDLLSLDLTSTPLLPELAITIFKRLPLLRMLKIDGSICDEVILRLSKAVQPMGQWICPKLQFLYLGMRALEPRNILTFLRQRLDASLNGENVSRIVELEIDGWDLEDERKCTAAEEIKRLVPGAIFRWWDGF